MSEIKPYEARYDETDSYCTVRLYRGDELIANFNGSGSMRWHFIESQKHLFEEAKQIAAALNAHATLTEQLAEAQGKVAELQALQDVLAPFVPAPFTPKTADLAVVLRDLLQEKTDG